VYGDYAGHYEGETLVIGTVGVKTDRPFAIVDMYGAPNSLALHVVERCRLVDDEQAQPVQARNMKEHTRTTDATSDLTHRGKQLQLVFTVTFLHSLDRKRVRCVNSRTFTLKQVSVGGAKHRLMSA
jgi:hypothetical protein